MMEWGWRRRGYSTCAGAGPASLRPERAGPLPDKSQLNELFPDRTRLNNMRNIENTLQMNLGDSYNSCRSTTTLYTDQENMYTTTEEQINMFTSNKDHYTAANNIKITKESLNLEAPTSGASEHKRRSELFPAIVGIANFISGFFNNITGVISFHQSRQTTAENIEKNNFSSKLEKEKVDFKVGPQDIFNVARYESFPEEDFFFTPRDTYDCRGQHFKVKHNEDLFFDSEPKDSGFDEADYINLDASPPIDEVDSISSFSRRDCSINSSQAIKNNTQVRPAQYVAGAAAARAPRPLLDSEGPEMDPVEQCRGKVAQIQHLLTNKTTDTPKTATKNNFPFTGYRPRARKVFVDPKSINVEDCVENFAPEPLAHMEGVVATEFVNPGVIAESELVRVETWPKVKLEPTYQQPVCFSSIVEPQGSEGSNVVVQKENNSVIKIPQEGCKSQKQPEQSIKIDESFDIVKPVSLEDISVKNDVIDISSARINETQLAVVSMSENELDSKVIDKTINLDANISQKLASSEQLNEKTVRKSELIAKKLENVATENNDHRISETIPIGTDEQTKLLENIVTKSTMISKNASDSSKNKTELISNCEDKVSKLKALLSERKKNNREAQRAQDAETNKETRRSPDRQSLVVNRRAPSNRCRNPNRLEINQKRKQLQRNINEDMCFIRNIDGEQAASSVEDSPQIVITPPDSDAFDEIRGQFTSRSASESDDSFIIVFSDSPVKSDVPRRRLPSDCGSEDSFIICFEDEVPGQSTCFTSNEVFSSADSDDELSDSDSGIKSNLLSHSFSRTVSDLTDESLYQEDAVLVSSACVESDEEQEQEEEEEEVKATGLLLTEQKKLARRGLPQKKVRFTERPPRVHVMRVWTFAARQARAGHWDKVVADRDRFKRRIADVDMAISWVLKRQHRARIKFQRFMPWWHAQRREEEALRKKREADALLRRTEEEAWLGEIESERNLEEEYGRTLGEHYVQLSREEASSGTACADVEGLVDIRDGCVEVHGENVISHDFCIECCDENVENLAVNVKSHDESVNSNNLDENLKENDNKPDSRVVVEAQVAPDIDVENVKSQNETQTYACIGNIVTTNKLTENSVANREVNPQASCAGRHFNPQRSANMRNNLYFSKVQKVQRYDKMSNALAKNDKVSISNSYKKSTQNIAGDQPRVPRVDGSVTGGVLT